MQGRFSGSTRQILFVLVLLVTFSTAGSAVRPSAADGGRRRFRAHGGRGDGARQARRSGDAGRGARRSDPAAAVVSAQLAAARGKYREAQAMLEPMAAREPAGEAALELALLYRTIGRSGDAQPLLIGDLPPGRRSSDPAVLLRAARAAHALNRPRDAKTFFNDAGACGRRRRRDRNRVGLAAAREVQLRRKR